MAFIRTRSSESKRENIFSHQNSTTNQRNVALNFQLLLALWMFALSAKGSGVEIPGKLMATNLRKLWVFTEKRSYSFHKLDCNNSPFCNQRHRSERFTPRHVRKSLESMLALLVVWGILFLSKSFNPIKKAHPRSLHSRAVPDARHTRKLFLSYAIRLIIRHECKYLVITTIPN